MRITKWTEYAVVMLQRLESCTKGPVSMTTLAQWDKLPQDFAEQIMLKLRRAGIVNSTRGAKGGYALSISGNALSMLQVFDAVEPDNYLVSLTTCPATVPMLVSLETAMRNTLAGMTLESTMPS